MTGKQIEEYGIKLQVLNDLNRQINEQRELERKEWEDHKHDFYNWDADEVAF